MYRMIRPLVALEDDLAVTILVAHRATDYVDQALGRQVHRALWNTV